MLRVRDRLSAPGRLPGVDLARGLAVLGMLAAHLLAIQPFSWGEPASWLALVEGRSSILFALLAGVSIALTTGGSEPVRGLRAGLARRRLLVRAAALWVLGILLIVTGVPVYVILPTYALLFVIATALVTLRAPALFAVAGALLVTMPFVQAALGLLPLWQTDGGTLLGYLIGWAYPFPLWAGYLAAGLAIGRIDLRAPRTAWRLLGAGTALAAIGYGLGGVWASAGWSDSSGFAEVVTSMAPHSGGLPEALGSTGFVVAVPALCLLVCPPGGRSPAAIVLWPLRATGSMPLTAYTLQLVIWAVWAFIALGDTTDLYGFRALDPFWPIALAVVVACTTWAALVGRGPLEQALNTVTRAIVRAGSS